MDPDKEHFLGEEMIQWADKVFDIIEQDMSAQALASLPPLSEQGDGPLVALVAQPVETAARAEAVQPEIPARAEAVVPAEVPARAQAVTTASFVAPAAPAEPPKKEPLLLKATLAFKSEPIPLHELLPYQESLVAYVYNVDKMIKGRYEERQILVLHLAHLALKPQKLKYKIGKRYKLRLDRMEGTLWETAKARDESGQINLQPYIRVEDRLKHPGNRTR